MRTSHYEGKSRAFWDKEYKEGQHFSLSKEPSEDLVKFVHWLEGKFGRRFLNPITSVLDLGCGNGRNLIALAQTFGMRGIGYDISGEAIAQATKDSKGLALTYTKYSIANSISLPNRSQTIVLDMMTSHFLSTEERVGLYAEITRVLKPGGWLFFKTFLRDEDLHAERLLKENPANEEGSYMHPRIGVPEHVFTEAEVVEMLDRDFLIHNIIKSHRHHARGRGAKRRSISVYAEWKER
jgi:SAM-dependent methyltransferase